MKKILFKYLILISYVFGLSGCGYLITFGIFMLDDRCADWNCTKLNPRWEKRVDDCENRNLEIIKQRFEYKDYTEVIFSKVGQQIQIPYQCRQSNGSYDVRKDKQYGHLFAE